MAEICHAGPGEPLDRHLAEVLQCVQTRGEKIARKLARVYNTTPEEALDVLAFAALMHDAGKADVQYADAQQYYPQHEAKSTAAAIQALKDAGLLKDCTPQDTIYTAALAAIALHHYAHKPPKKDTPATTYNPRCKIPTDSWNPKTETGKKLKQAIQNLTQTQNLCYQTITQAAEHKKLPPKTLLAAKAILGILNQCDREIAKKNRNPQHTQQPTNHPPP